MVASTGRRKVAIVGGGCGGVAAAFWLSSPELEGAFEVTLYSQGWRLGGKGASGRRSGPDHAIKEHGLHLWFGCYQRAFQLMRLCYAEQIEPRGIASVEDAFVPIYDLALESRGGPADNPSWSTWTFSFPRQGDFPGGERPPSLLDRLTGVAQWLVQSMGRFLGGLGRPPPSPRRRGHPWKRLAILVNLGFAFAWGYLRDVLLHPDGAAAGIAALDDLDFRDWLSRSGAGADACQSAPVRSLYDLAFAYPGGDTANGGQLAAGAAVGLVRELIGYRGAPVFKMALGMGDTIFAPIFRVLEARGVRIELFHRLDEVELNETGTGIGGLRFKQQVDLVADRYNPLFEVAGADCWPDQPFWDQIVGGAELARAGVNFEHDDDDTHAGVLRLSQREHFDAVVLAIPPDALKPVTQAIDHPAWKRMLGESASVATQSFQLWLDRPIRDLGWEGPDVVSAYQAPFSTWADMSHLMAKEAWPDKGAPRSLHYFCGPMPEAQADAPDARRRVQPTLEAWLDHEIETLWPASHGDWRGALVDSWAQANIDASERYVLAMPGGTQARLPPTPGILDNLFLAGDWTRTRYCGGCVENAVQAGLSVARALSGRANLGGGGPL